MTNTPARPALPSLIGLTERDRLAIGGDVDQRVSVAAPGANEIAPVPVNLRRDSPEQDTQSTSSTGPHGIVSDSVEDQHSTVPGELARMQADGLVHVGTDGRVALTRAGHAYANARGFGNRGRPA